MADELALELGEQEPLTSVRSSEIDEDSEEVVSPQCLQLPFFPVAMEHVSADCSEMSSRGVWRYMGKYVDEKIQLHHLASVLSPDPTIELPGRRVKFTTIMFFFIGVWRSGLVE